MLRWEWSDRGGLECLSLVVFSWHSSYLTDHLLSKCQVAVLARYLLLKSPIPKSNLPSCHLFYVNSKLICTCQALVIDEQYKVSQIVQLNAIGNCLILAILLPVIEWSKCSCTHLYLLLVTYLFVFSLWWGLIHSLKTSLTKIFLSFQVSTLTAAPSHMTPGTRRLKRKKVIVKFGFLSVVYVDANRNSWILNSIHYFDINFFCHSLSCIWSLISYWCWQTLPELKEEESLLLRERRNLRHVWPSKTLGQCLMLLSL